MGREEVNTSLRTPHVYLKDLDGDDIVIFIAHIVAITKGIDGRAILEMANGHSITVKESTLIVLDRVMKSLGWDRNEHR